MNHEKTVLITPWNHDHIGAKKSHIKYNDSRICQTGAKLSLIAVINPSSIKITPIILMILTTLTTQITLITKTTQTTLVPLITIKSQPKPLTSLT